MTQNIYQFPPGQSLITTSRDGTVTMHPQFYRYLQGLEDTSKRVAEYVDPSTATAQTVAQALIDANLMKSS